MERIFPLKSQRHTKLVRIVDYCSPCH